MRNANNPNNPNNLDPLAQQQPQQPGQAPTVFLIPWDLFGPDAGQNQEERRPPSGPSPGGPAL